MQGEALEVLRAVATPGGFLASPEARANYRRVWARDGVITSLAALLTGDPELVGTARATINTLASHQDAHGRIPSNVAQTADGSTRAVSFGGIACRTDAAAWFVIGAAHVAAVSTPERERLSRAAERALGWLAGQALAEHDLVYMPEGGDWADEYPLSGYALGLQLLRLWALRLDAEVFGRERSAARAAALESVLATNYWRREQPLAEVIHPPAYAQLQAGPPLAHWVAGWKPSGYDPTFDGLANALALLLLDEPAEAASTAGFALQLAADNPAGLVPAFWPWITPESTGWAALSQLHGGTFRNEPGAYHNGGLWPMNNGFWGAALAARGRLDDARQLLRAVERANHDARTPFPEFLHADDARPGGVSPCAWSAAAPVLIEAVLGGRRLLGVVQPPQPPRSLVESLVSALGPPLADGKAVIAIAGETGSGKTTLAAALANRFAETGSRVRVLHQDDYYHLSPAENDARRRADPEWRGPKEVDLARLEAELEAFVRGEGLDVDVILVEGTFVTLLQNVEARVFLAATYQDTQEARRRRGREPLDAHLEQVLATEHEIVRAHRAHAQWVVESDGTLSTGGD